MQQIATARDTLPRATDDCLLDYRGNNGAAAQCRVRVYEPEGRAAVIVATELPNNPGASVTNTAERVHYLAWEKAGCPLPVVFIEHYPGRVRSESERRTLDTEEFDQVVFPTDREGVPNFRERMLYPGRWEMQFDEADWRPLGREALLGFISADPLASKVLR